MAGYRLYYLDKDGHVVGREEFLAEDDDAALSVAASFHHRRERVHAGVMLWQGARQVFATDDDGAPLVVLPTAGYADRGRCDSC